MSYTVVDVDISVV